MGGGGDSDGFRNRFCVQWRRVAKPEKRKKKREKVRVGGKDGLPECLQMYFLLPTPPPPLFQKNLPLYHDSPRRRSPLLPPTSFFAPLSSLSSSLGRISWVSLEGKCNNAPTRWNRARSIISREMDGPCRAGGGHERTQFRFNKLAKQDPQSDLSLTRRRCLLLQC